MRSFAEKGFPNCHGCIDCTHIYVDKPANRCAENYFDRKHRYSVVAQVVVDLDLRILDVQVGYPGSCHDSHVLQTSKLWKRAHDGELFRAPVIALPLRVRTSGYILGDNGYPPMEWVVVPYGGMNQEADEERFDNKHAIARGAVERAFGRLKGMWRLFLRAHKTNIFSLPQQFVAVATIHNILLDTGVAFDESLLWEEDANGRRTMVDLGMDDEPRPMAPTFSSADALTLRDALSLRMKAESM